MKAAQQILEIFEARGIDTVFGYPGGCIMPFYDALVDSVGVTHVLCRHEQGCALAADGYARSSGRVGVAIATSGPGATNLITGVANAHRDSVPMLVITGQAALPMIGTDAFQEVDVLGMTLDIVKHSALITRPEDVGPAIEQALQLAASGRPGPVWIDIPVDVLRSEAPPAADRIRAPATGARVRAPAATEIAATLDMLRRARRPLLYSGGGVSRAGAEAAFRAFADTSGLPHVHSLNGIGNAGRANIEGLGMLGMHGSKAANTAVDACDLLIVVGARLDDRATGRLDSFAPNARLVHIDIDAAELNKLRGADIAVRADLTATLSALSAALVDSPLAIAAWRRRCREWQTEQGAGPAAASHGAIAGPAFIRALSGAAPDDTIVACDVGQHQMWVAQHFRFAAPRHHLSSGGLGTMGYGLPAAIGAQFAHPTRTVINIAGDGSFMMNVQELATIRRHRLPVKIVIADNACLGMVRQQQELFYANRESQIDLDDNPDFVALAAAFDIPTYSARCWGDVQAGLRALLDTPGPVLLHVAIDRTDNVWPTVAPGCANRDMLHAAPLSTTSAAIAPAIAEA